MTLSIIGLRPLHLCTPTAVHFQLLVCIISIFRESSLQQVLNNAQMELDALRDEMQQSARQAKINESK